MENASKVNTEFLLSAPLEQLILEANRVRKENAGKKLDVCNILNAKSGLCSENCKFCAQSSHHKTAAEVYPLKSTQEIIEAGKKAKSIGAKRFGIVTSGNCLTENEVLTIAKAIKRLKEEVGIIVCGSLGALSLDQLILLKDSGLSRYHHNIETSRNFYSKIVTTHDFDERIKTIKAAKFAGLEVCSGGIIGMGESWQDRLDMAMCLKELDVDSVPLNVLTPIKGTPLEHIAPISCNDVVRAICIFRIILKDKVVKLAAGRETALKDFQALAFMAGANGMLIGGYLTIKGRDVGADQALIKEIEQLWNG